MVRAAPEALEISAAERKFRVPTAVVPANRLAESSTILKVPVPVSVRLPKFMPPVAARLTSPESPVKWALPVTARLSAALSPRLIEAAVKVALPVTATVAAVPSPSVRLPALVRTSEPAEDEAFSAVAESS